MKIFRLQNLLTLGLLVKLSGLILALVLAWPLLSPSPRAVQAEEKKAAAEKAPAAKDTKAPAEKDKAAAKAKDQAKAKDEAKPAGDKKDADDKKPAFDPRLIEIMEQQRKEIAMQKAQVERERKDLEKLREEVNLRIGELKKVQVVLEQLVATEQKQRRQRLEQLVKVLSNMRPPSAAAVVEKLDDQMAVDIFELMQSRIAGKVMASLQPTQAARIGELLTRRKQAQKAAQIAGQAAAQGVQPPQAAQAPAPTAAPAAAPRR